MSKTTFLGYVPSLKSKHEATIVGHKAIQSKGGSIRYTLQGEYQGRKTLPKTVSKADFEGVYGFDAKEAESAIIIGKNKKGDVDVLGYTTDAKDKTGFTPEKIVKWDSKELKDLQHYSNHDADTVGNPSPASVEPPAPSESPFPQEPSNETFSADEGFFQIDVKHKMEDGWEHYGDYDNEEDATSAYYDIYLNHPEVVLLEVDADGDGDVIYTQRNYNLDVKEAFGFGKKEEESEEPKTQEFTVVMQEGDKLELTDITEEEEQQPADDEPKEEDSPEESENEEKEADEDMVERTFFITDAWYDTYDDNDEDSFEDQYGYNQSEEQPKFEDEDLTLTIDAYPQEGYGEISDSLVDALSNSTGFGVYHFSFVEIMPDGSKKVLEAVQAKVTRPVKEDEEPEEESDEGLSTGAKVALGVGALAAGVALFGAEDDYIPYESETDYTEIYGATSGDGYINHDRIDTEEKRMVELRHDDPTTYYNWNSPYDVDESDVDDAVKDELGDEPNEGNYDATVEVLGSKYGENGQKYVDVDVDMDTDYGDSRFMGMAAETFESKGNMMVRLQEVDGEAPHYNCPYCRNELTVLGGKGGIVAVCENESRCNGLELPRQYLEDYEKYHWYVNERKSSDAESKEAESKNLKMALGMTAVGIGLAAVLGKDKIKTLFDRFGL
jgi:hypothetical protein